MEKEIIEYATDFQFENWSNQDKFLLSPFATGLEGSVHVLRNLPPEIAGALCSRASRAEKSLLRVLLDEYFYPILNGENKELAAELKSTVEFLSEHGFKNILNNQRAQAFYAKWLSQFGDDSIAQMTGTHLLFDGISQVALKYLENQRIGLEPIEKSTRYVNFGGKINSRYLYYTPAPDLKKLNLLSEYREVLDLLFDTYVDLLPKVKLWLAENFVEKESILEKKAFDTLRGLLPMATLGQVAFRGNAQSFEYQINRAETSGLGELRWIAEAAKNELDQEIPSLLLRLDSEKTQEYRQYLTEFKKRSREFVENKFSPAELFSPGNKPQVILADYDTVALDKILTSIVFSASHLSWQKASEKVENFSADDKKELLKLYFSGRAERWQKVGRALENSYLRFEIVMNIGAYRDLHRHRMATQERQLFSCPHGFDLPVELKEAKLNAPFEKAMQKAAELFSKIEVQDPKLAQYVVPLAFRMRFYQWQNFRQVFWETELRTISQGHPDYRFIEQEKYRLVKEKFPEIAEFILVDTQDYTFARRGTEEQIARKEKSITEKLKIKTR